MSLGDLLIQKRIQGGDINEFRQLFTRYYEPLCKHAFTILHDMDMAEDIVQEFFYNFWKNRDALSPKLSLNAYLYQSIRNNSLHLLQHQAIQKRYAETIVKETEQPEPVNEEYAVELEELQKAIDITLTQMPDRCSRIFRMNRFEGKKYSEIAEILSISIKTVEADMGKAIQLFRINLKEFINQES